MVAVGMLVVLVTAREGGKHLSRRQSILSSQWEFKDGWKEGPLKNLRRPTQKAETGRLRFHYLPFKTL
ncbi:hypothetical protein NC653_041072 [Populus alba x Populus x berolinensis]|uniref:Uncharacterized protein n=1 Tax=Populus alba x Populus x berolinensis TaxID=444605 RepID=A0AAD6L8L9_9ROSI|nr:hypothetical protein NC653_041072 [Populus alba x Populus x berolinensis]